MSRVLCFFTLRNLGIGIRGSTWLCDCLPFFPPRSGSLSGGDATVCFIEHPVPCVVFTLLFVLGSFFPLSLHFHPPRSRCAFASSRHSQPWSSTSLCTTGAQVGRHEPFLCCSFASLPFLTPASSCVLLPSLPARCFLCSAVLLLSFLVLQGTSSCATWAATSSRTRTSSSMAGRRTCGASASFRLLFLRYSSSSSSLLLLFRALLLSSLLLSCAFSVFACPAFLSRVSSFSSPLFFVTSSTPLFGFLFLSSLALLPCSSMFLHLLFLSFC